MLTPGFDIRWIRLDASGDDASLAEVEHIGQGNHFLLLPYDREELLPRMPNEAGGVRLVDSTGDYNSLELRECTCQLRPESGQTVTNLLEVAAAVPLLESSLRRRTILPLVGIWFDGEIWGLSKLRDELRQRNTGVAGRSGTLQPAILPVGAEVRVEVESDGNASLVAIRRLASPIQEGVNLRQVLPQTPQLGRETADLAARANMRCASCFR